MMNAGIKRAVLLVSVIGVFVVSAKGYDPVPDFEKAFGAEAKKVNESEDKADDVKFAAKMLYAAKQLKENITAKSFYLEKAAEFGLRDKAGHETAREAARLLVETAEEGTTEKAQEKCDLIIEKIDGKKPPKKDDDKKDEDNEDAADEEDKSKEDVEAEKLLKLLAEAQKKMDEDNAKKDDEEGWINLLKKVDAKKDGVRGKWEIKDGELLCDAGSYSMLKLPYHVGAKYDFEIEFTRQSGDGGVVQLLSGGGKPFAWGMGLFENKWFGFFMIDGEHVDENATGVERKLDLKKKHTVLVQVRSAGARVYFDGDKVATHKSDGFGDLKINRRWYIKDSKALGLGSHNSKIIFHKIRVKEVEGKGELTRE